MAQYAGETITLGHTLGGDYVAIYKGDELIQYYHEPSSDDLLHILGIPYEEIDLEGDGLPNLGREEPPASLKKCREWLDERRKAVLQEKKSQLLRQVEELDKELGRMN